MKFEGIYTPAITPLAADGSIDKAAFADVLESLIAARVHGIIIAGSTGEYYAHTTQERLELAAHAKEVIGTRTQLIIGTGTVNKVYEEFLKETGITAATKEEVKAAAAAR